MGRLGFASMRSVWKVLTPKPGPRPPAPPCKRPAAPPRPLEALAVPPGLPLTPPKPPMPPPCRTCRAPRRLAPCSTPPCAAPAPRTRQRHHGLAVDAITCSVTLSAFWRYASSTAARYPDSRAHQVSGDGARATESSTTNAVPMPAGSWVFRRTVGKAARSASSSVAPPM